MIIGAPLVYSKKFILKKRPRLPDMSPAPEISAYPLV